MDHLRIMSYVGIITIGWDILSHFKSEMAFLSGSSCELNIIKALYVVTRYSPFLIYSGCIIFASTIQNHIPHTPTRLCQSFALFATISCQWMACLLVMSLMFRVYALYNRSPYVILTLIFLLACKILVSFLVWEKAIQHTQQRFTPTCVPLFKQSLYTVLYSLTEFLTVGTPVYLILQRSSKLESSIIREGAVETKKLIAAVRRGGIITWSAIALFAIIENVVAIYRKDTGAETQQIFFPLFIMLGSFGGCRLILQLRKSKFAPSVPVGRNEDWEVPPDFELSTYDSTWDAQTLVEQLEQSSN